MIPEKFHDRREEGNTTLRKCQLIQLHLLYVIDEVCKQNGFKYFLCGGTLIGAMRHNGFIPWDDDLDICMPIKDYKRFLKIAKDVLPSDTYLQTPSDVPGVAIPFSKLRDRNSFYCEIRNDLRTSDPSGIYVDIFPVEPVPNIGYGLQSFLSRTCGWLWMRTQFFYGHRGCNFFAIVGSAFLGLLCQVGHVFLRLLISVLNAILPSGRVFACLENGFKHGFETKYIYPLTTHQFEDAEFPVPYDSDTILTVEYGNWREIPPPEKRPRHARIIDPFYAAKE